MKLFKFLKCLIFVTILALVYVHLQMQIIDLAYLGNTKEERIKKLNEEKGRIVYSIEKLKSAVNIGNRMLVENNDLQFAEPASVIHIKMPEYLIKEEGYGVDKVSLNNQRINNPLLSLLAIGKRAEARMRE